MLLLCFLPSVSLLPLFFFFFNDTATTEIYTLSLHDALPICHGLGLHGRAPGHGRRALGGARAARIQLVFRSEPASTVALRRDRKSTRLNSSHQIISYAVFCLKKKKSKRVHTVYYFRCPMRTH